MISIFICYPIHYYYFPVTFLFYQIVFPYLQVRILYQWNPTQVRGTMMKVRTWKGACLRFSRTLLPGNPLFKYQTCIFVIIFIGVMFQKRITFFSCTVFCSSVSTEWEPRQRKWKELQEGFSVFASLRRHFIPPFIYTQMCDSKRISLLKGTRSTESVQCQVTDRYHSR